MRFSVRGTHLDWYQNLKWESQKSGPGGSSYLFFNKSKMHLSNVRNDLARSVYPLWLTLRLCRGENGQIETFERSGNKQEVYLDGDLTRLQKDWLQISWWVSAGGRCLIFCLTLITLWTNTIHGQKYTHMQWRKRSNTTSKSTEILATKCTYNILSTCSAERLQCETVMLHYWTIIIDILIWKQYFNVAVGQCGAVSNYLIYFW